MATDKIARDQELLSDTPIPPGETIEEEIEFIGMTRQELSVETGIPNQTLVEIIKGKTPVTQEIAVALERVLGVSASLLVNLEARYQRTLAHKKEREKSSKAV